MCRQRATKIRLSHIEITPVALLPSWFPQAFVSIIISGSIHKSNIDEIVYLDIYG